MNENCLFCKIISGEIKCHKIYENDFILAFLDISPFSKGHTLIIPKKHYDTFLDISENDSAEYFKYINRISKMIKSKLNCDGFQLCINIGKDAGQEIMHQHVHLIPKWRNLDTSLDNKNESIYDENYFESIKKLFI